jgi:hypothetical protein
MAIGVKSLQRPAPFASPTCRPARAGPFDSRQILTRPLTSNPADDTALRFSPRNRPAPVASAQNHRVHWDMWMSRTRNDWVDATPRLASPITLETSPGASRATPPAPRLSTSATQPREALRRPVVTKSPQQRAVSITSMKLSMLPQNSPTQRNSQQQPHPQSRYDNSRTRVPSTSLHPIQHPSENSTRGIDTRARSNAQQRRTTENQFGDMLFPKPGSARPVWAGMPTSQGRQERPLLATIVHERKKRQWPSPSTQT